MCSNCMPSIFVTCLEAEGRTHREEQGDESPEFEDFFPEGYTYIEGQFEHGSFL